MWRSRMEIKKVTEKWVKDKMNLRSKILKKDVKGKSKGKG